MEVLFILYDNKSKNTERNIHLQTKNNIFFDSLKLQKTKNHEFVTVSVLHSV